MSGPQMIDALEPRQLFAAAPQVVGYLPDWNAGHQMVTRIDWSTVTHLNYFSVIPNASGNIPGADGKPAKSMSGYSLNQLKDAAATAHAHGKKISIVIGGAGYAPTKAIENVLATEAKRTTFANSLKKFCATYKLDGVDIDYEPSGPSNTQIANYGKLIKKVNQTLPAKLTVTAAVAAETLPNGNNWGDRRYVLNAEAVRNLDRIGVMSYDFTPGEGHSEWNRSFASLANWGKYVNKIQPGAKSKLLLGLPFYGRAGSADWGNPGTTGIASYGAIARSYAAAHGGQFPGPHLDNVTAVINDPGMEANGQAVSWSYNGPATIAAKTSNALWDGAGGVMVWDLSQDYFTPAGKYDPSRSLLPAVKRGVQTWKASQTGGSAAAATAVVPASVAQARFSAAPITLAAAGGGGDDAQALFAPATDARFDFV